MQPCVATAFFMSLPPRLKAIYSKISQVPSQPGVRSTYRLEQRSSILEGRGPKQSSVLAHLNWAEAVSNQGFCVCNLSLNRQKEPNFARELPSFLIATKSGAGVLKSGRPLLIIQSSWHGLEDACCRWRTLKALEGPGL